MLTLKQIQEILRNISYKDWKFAISFVDNTWDHLFLELTFLAEDVDSPGKIGTFNFRRVFTLESFPSKTIFIDFIWHAILAVERHESGHFFSYKGVRPFEEETQNVGLGFIKDLG
jgi:hypothetical protein